MVGVVAVTTKIVVKKSLMLPNLNTLNVNNKVAEVHNIILGNIKLGKLK